MTEAVPSTNSSEILDLKLTMESLAKFTRKVHQVHTLYSEIWDERITIYTQIFVELKKGRGFLKKKQVTLEKDFSGQTRRIATLNSREWNIVGALSSHMQETAQLKETLLRDLKKIRLGGMSAFDLVNHEELDRMAVVTDEYFKSMIAVQTRFLKQEQKFIENPHLMELGNLYCDMQHLALQLESFTKKYLPESPHMKSTLDMNRRLSAFVTSVNKGIIDVERKGNAPASTLLQRIKRDIEPYLRVEHANVYGTVQQRVSFLTKRVPESTASMIIRMGIIAPLIIESTISALGYKPSLRFTFVSQYPQFYVDFYLFLVSYLAYVLDIGPGLSQYSISGVRNLMSFLRKKIGSENPFNFSCPEYLTA